MSGILRGLWAGIINAIPMLAALFFVVLWLAFGIILLT